MKHRIINRLGDIHPYELLKVEIIPENINEAELTKTNSEEIEKYLIFELNAIAVIETNYPFYTIKTLKNNIGIG